MMLSTKTMHGNYQLPALQPEVPNDNNSSSSKMDHIHPLIPLPPVNQVKKSRRKVLATLVPITLLTYYHRVSGLRPVLLAYKFLPGSTCRDQLPELFVCRFRLDNTRPLPKDPGNILPKLCNLSMARNLLVSKIRSFIPMVVPRL